MRKFIIAIAIISTLQWLYCIKDKQLLTPQDKYFDPQNLQLLDLKNVNEFWLDDAIKDSSEYISTLFNEHPGFIKGIRYEGEIKSISVSIFQTQQMALNAMELTINDVACLIQKDTSKSGSDLWWFSDCIPDMVFTNKWNTIIEVSWYHSNFEEIKETLYETVIEIANRVDNSSD